MKKFLLLLVVMLTNYLANSQIYKDKTQDIDLRVEDLLGRMTLEEKFYQMFMIPGNSADPNSVYSKGIFGLQVNTVSSLSNNIANQMLTYNMSGNAFYNTQYINSLQKYFVDSTRLGIPMIPFDEGLHGLVRSGSTSFPQAIALAASFDTVLLAKVSKAIADECRSRGIRMVLSPVINLASDVRWGRVEETFGEDPFLSAMMAAVYVDAFEKQGVITCPKHFASNVGAGGRDSYPVEFNERHLRETELVPFNFAFKNGARSVMTSYNALNGRPCTANNWLLNDLLKKEWNFQGFVISDAGAVGGANVLHFTTHTYPESSAESIINGLDVIFQTDIRHAALFIPPFLDGTIPQKRIDDAVRRVLKAKFQLGLFENPYAIPEDAAKINLSEEHRQLALEAARKSVVLLKNDKNVLPLAGNVSKIFICGEDAVEARLGGYSGTGNPVSIIKALDSLFTGKKISYHAGMKRNIKEFEAIPDSCFWYEKDGKLQAGIQSFFYNTMNCKGEPLVSRIDSKIQYQWTLFSPDQQKINYDFFSAKWVGKIRSIATGNFKIGVDGNDGYKLFINGKLILDNSLKLSRKELKTVDFYFEKGKYYDIQILYNESAGNAWFSLVWNQGFVDYSEKQLASAIKQAALSDVIVVVAGLEEGEFRDRALLNLPGNQELWIQKLSETGKPVVVVLVGGSAITMNSWLNKVDAVVDVWYNGDMGGYALAEVLSGKYNPAGRLPITFPVHEGQLPLTYYHKPTGRGDDYVNMTGQALFPFGFGLSYTRFDYSNAVLEKNTIAKNESTTIHFVLENTGKMDGEEVVQLYIRDEFASVSRPLTELKAFQRVFLKAGEKREIEFIITPDMLKMLDENLNSKVESGTFRIGIGASCKDIKIREILLVN